MLGRAADAIADPEDRRDVEGRDPRPGLAPLDDEVEILTRRMDRALAVLIRAVTPDVGHTVLANSTARFAPSSIVASG